MSIVVFSEYEVRQALIVVYDWQSVELVIPKNVVGLTECAAVFDVNELFEWCHELADLSVCSHPADTVVTAGHQS